MALAIPIGLISKGIYTGLITGISTITMGTCRTIGSIYNHKNPNVDRELKRLDVERRINIVASYIDKYPWSESENINNEIDPNNSKIFEIIDGEQTIMRNSSKLTLIYLEQTIQDINGILQKIKEKADNHHHKWFHNWRTFNVQKEINNLEESLRIMDDLFDKFIKIISSTK